MHTAGKYTSYVDVLIHFLIQTQSKFHNHITVVVKNLVIK